MAHSYASAYPDVPVLAGIPEFFQNFYQTSDTPGVDDKYTTYFTKDATFILASKTSKGHDGKPSISQTLHFQSAPPAEFP
jgi:hypothetical protein